MGDEGFGRRLVGVLSAPLRNNPETCHSHQRQLLLRDVGGDVSVKPTMEMNHFPREHCPAAFGGCLEMGIPAGGLHYHDKNIIDLGPFRGDPVVGDYAFGRVPLPPRIPKGSPMLTMLPVEPAPDYFAC